MPRKVDRTRDCNAADARTRLRQARLYLEVAELILDEGAEYATVATGNAVLAGIAAADAICCARAGAMHKGQDHAAAATHLEQVTGDRQLAGRLRDLVDLKEASHYGLRDVLAKQAHAAVRKARQLLEAAQQSVRGA